MQRYIDADALQQKMTQLRLEQSGDMDKINLIWQVQDMILQAPTADVREVMASAWIPVSERLPEKNEECLISTVYRDVATGSFFHDSWYDGEFIYDKYKVTAWMPMPESYRGDE